MGPLNPSQGDLVIGVVTTALTLVVLLALVHVPMGRWIVRTFTDTTHWRVERAVYRVVGVAPETEQTWQRYAVSLLAFSAVSLVGLWTLIMVQGFLPLQAGREGMGWDTAVNTAISFVTNTNWQSYAGEVGTTHLTQMLGLTVQNFVSAAVGLSVAIALIRGLTRRGSDRIGNFWVDLTRGCLRILLPVATLGALALLAGGVIQNLADPVTVSTVTGGQQVIQGGPVASQEAIKLLGTNGGGFFNANSAHPFENPTALTNLIEMFLIMLIPTALPYAYGRMVGDRRQGWTVLAFMGTLATLSLTVATWSEVHAATLAGGALEGKELRLGLPGSLVFGTVTTGTSTGAVNSMHESYSAISGGAFLSNMLLGEVTPGGVGTGLYGVLVLAILTVFLSGLMVGRTPELLGKQIGRREITLVALTTLTMPALVLLGTAVATSVPSFRDARLADGPHGLSELLYALASTSNNNGSAFAGLSADQPLINLVLGAAMLLGRFVPIVLVLALAGSLAAQRPRPISPGTLPTTGPTFTGLLVAVALIVGALTFFPALTLGPLAEALS